MSDSQIQFTQEDLILAVGELELTRRALAKRIEQLESMLAELASAREANEPVDQNHAGVVEQ